MHVATAAALQKTLNADKMAFIYGRKIPYNITQLSRKHRNCPLSQHHNYIDSS